MADETGEIAQLHRPRRTSCAEKNSRKNKIRREWGVSHQPANSRMANAGLLAVDALYKSGGGGFSYVGDTLNIVGNGKTYKIHVKDGKVTFDSLSLLSSDEKSIIFVGYPTTFSKVDDDLRIFEYALDGAPLAVYRVHFPDEIGFHRYKFSRYKLEKIESGFRVVVYKSEKDEAAHVELLSFTVPK